MMKTCGLGISTLGFTGRGVSRHASARGVCGPALSAIQSQNRYYSQGNGWFQELSKKFYVSSFNFCSKTDREYRKFLIYTGNVDSLKQSFESPFFNEEALQDAVKLAISSKSFTALSELIRSPICTPKLVEEALKQAAKEGDKSSLFVLFSSPLCSADAVKNTLLDLIYNKNDLEASRKDFLNSLSPLMQEQFKEEWKTTVSNLSSRALTDREDVGNLPLCKADLLALESNMKYQVYKANLNKLKRSFEVLLSSKFVDMTVFAEVWDKAVLYGNYDVLPILIESPYFTPDVMFSSGVKKCQSFFDRLLKK